MVACVSISGTEGASTSGSGFLAGVSPSGALKATTSGSGSGSISSACSSAFTGSGSTAAGAGSTSGAGSDCDNEGSAADRAEVTSGVEGSASAGSVGLRGG
eukprot:1315979-Rhodomonas_salina.1